MKAKTTETFDYIIIGGGTAGCVLANRLTASGQHSVLVLEAGGAGQSPWVSIPAGFSKLLTNPRHNWCLQTEPEATTENRIIPIPKGRGLGGDTLINGMIFVRGQPQDYDGWDESGCDGWGWSDVLPYFKRFEDYDGPSDPRRARGGPLPITTVYERPPISDAFIAAGEQAGHPINPDYNAASQQGFGYYQVNQRGGRRVSAADAYLKPALGRHNLLVMTNAQVQKINLKQGRATGVTALVNNTQRTFNANAEVILSAGAIKSPQILELSGIGDPEVLKAVGLPVEHALTGVGANYMDHYCTRMNWRVKLPVTLNESTRGWRLIREVIKYGLTRRGVLSYGTGLAYGFMKTRADVARPDVQLFFMHASYANAAKRVLDHKPGMTVGVSQMRPESRGTIHITSPEARNPPAIRPNFLAAEEDGRCMVEGMKLTRDVIEQSPMDIYRDFELNPGADCQSDDDWLNFARRNGQTIYHPTGTCKMGRGGDAVVDPQLKVHGIKSLRVVDASIIPTITSGNTQAPVYMIAEKAADLILADANLD